MVSPVTELDVDDESVPDLCQLGLHAACPRVHKLTLSCDETVTADIIKRACSSFDLLTELHVTPHPAIASDRSLHDAVAFCDAVISSCPRLNKLSITDIRLGNDEAAKILEGMKAHSSLESIT